MDKLPVMEGVNFLPNGVLQIDGLLKTYSGIINSLLKYVKGVLRYISKDLTYLDKMKIIFKKLCKRYGGQYFVFLLFFDLTKYYITIRVNKMWRINLTLNGHTLHMTWSKTLMNIEKYKKGRFIKKWTQEDILRLDTLIRQKVIFKTSKVTKKKLIKKIKRKKKKQNKRIN